METVGRFAPSPSGRVHLGNLFCALLAWLSAKRDGGRVILRIEDLDTARCKPSYAAQLEEDLRWLGLLWDEGGSGGGPHAPYDQSRRTALYEAALERLRGTGSVYPCYCTRAQLLASSAPHREDGLTVYAGTCRDLSPEERQNREAAGRSPAMRLRVPDEDVTFIDGHMGPVTESLPRDCGDFLLRRSDGLFAYQLAVVVDDAAMGVTQVVRGADLLSSTPRQLLLYRLLDAAPPQFFHVPLLLAPDGRRLSKRDGDIGLDALARRCAPREIIGALAYLAGLNPEKRPCTPADLIGEFSWERVPKDDIRLPADLF